METTQKKSTKIVGIKNAGYYLLFYYSSVYLSFYFGKSH